MMSRTLDVLMAGLIAGIVAYTTSQLGIGGTVLGAVLGSMLYQLMSHIIKEPVGSVRTQKVEREIFFVFPLVVIVAIEMIYLLSSIYHRPEQIFFTLENVTGDNLFKAMGVGLIVMGLYPILQPESIKRLYGYILLVVGVVKLLVGFVDVKSPVVMLYAPLFQQLNEVISIVVIAAIIFVIVSIARESVTIILQKDKEKDIKLINDTDDS